MWWDWMPSHSSVNSRISISRKSLFFFKFLPKRNFSENDYLLVNICGLRLLDGQKDLNIFFTHFLFHLHWQVVGNISLLRTIKSASICHMRLTQREKNKSSPLMNWRLIKFSSRNRRFNFVMLVRRMTLKLMQLTIVPLGSPNNLSIYIPNHG